MADAVDLLAELLRERMQWKQVETRGDRGESPCTDGGTWSDSSSGNSSSHSLVGAFKICTTNNHSISKSRPVPLTSGGIARNTSGTRSAFAENQVRTLRALARNDSESSNDTTAYTSSLPSPPPLSPTSPRSRSRLHSDGEVGDIAFGFDIAHDSEFGHFVHIDDGGADTPAYCVTPGSPHQLEPESPSLTLTSSSAGRVTQDELLFPIELDS